MAISGNRMFQNLKKLNFVRLSAHEGELKAAKIIADEVEKLGVTPVTEAFKVPYFEVKTAKLEMTEPVYREFPVAAYGYCGNDAKDGIEAELVYLEGFDAIDLENVTGKIALVNGRISVDNYQKLRERNVAGILTTTGTFLDNASNSDLEDGLLRSTYLEFGKVPTLNIKINDAAKLLASKAKKVRITLEQFEQDRDSHNVIAEVKGTKRPDEVVIYTAHYDSVQFSHGMFDNGSGSVMLLELLKQFNEKKPDRTVRFVWCGSEERGLLGSKAYIEAHPDELANIRLCINIDMVGPLLGRDGAIVTGEEKICNAIEFIYKQVGHPMYVRQDTYSSDSIPFAEKGIPGVNFVRNCAPGGSQIHCRHDVLSILAPETLESTGKFVMTFSDLVVNAASFPFDRKMPDNMVDKVDKYLRKKK